MPKATPELKAPARDNPYVKNGRRLLELLDENQHQETLFLERVVLIAIMIVSLITPGMLVRFLCGRISLRCRKIGIEVYVLFKTALAFFILFADKGHHCWLSVILSILFLSDLFSNLFALVLLRDFWSTPLSLNRSLILLGFNFLEFNAWFACIYLFNQGLREGNANVVDPLTAFYFSVVTSTTVGYGDILPIGHVRWIAIAHLMLSVGFLAVVVAYFVGTLGEKRRV